MRRRRTIEVWPAFADLMTVLSVPGLFLALGLLATFGDDVRLLDRTLSLEARNRELTAELEKSLELVRRASGSEAGIEEVRQELRERARNQAMFRAIQEVQELIDGIAAEGSLQFSADQTLQFGDDLVEFDLNSVEPTWKADSKERLLSFCQALNERLDGSLGSLGPLRRFLTVLVEGHSDSSQCAADPNCNWWISSARAAVFLAYMRDANLCPAGAAMELRSIGFADTEPISTDGELRATRRIALRVVPNYREIIASASGDAQSP